MTLHPPRNRAASSTGPRDRGPAVSSGGSARNWARVDPALPLLAALPWALLLIDPNWIFSDLYNDPWIYFGYFLNLPGHLRTFGDLYFSDRLAVTVPGYLCHRLLPVVAAHLLLHLG